MGLVVCIMGQNCEKFISMCYESIQNADEIIYCDGGSTDGTLRYIWERGINNLKVKIIENPYDQDDKGMNGKQRNFYLSYLKQNHPDDWALCLDADEVVEDLSKIKEFVKNAQYGCYSVKMRHFIGDLGHEDAVSPVHYVLNRLFKISEVKGYPEVEHPVLIPNGQVGRLDLTTIWHLSYIPNLFEFKKKYENHLKKSNMHNPEYLKGWYYSHLFGSYPKSQVNPVDIPSIILNHFGVDKDEFYFQNRGLEVKHFMMFKSWLDYYLNIKPVFPVKVLELGCGFGPFGVVAKINNCEYTGIEISKYATNLNPFRLNLVNADITKYETQDTYDICLFVDILEHISYENIDNLLQRFIKSGKLYIFSIPFKGDANLEQDNTHIIKEGKDWWLNKLSNYLSISEAPPEWAFSNQILVGVPK
jgi:glycosyltransferase involved in cell wall biosynthesis